jgi:serine O-acetyltransferase
MDDRAYLAEALFSRMGEESIRYSMLGPEDAPQAELAVAAEDLGRLPRLVARFCHDFDLQLVQLWRPELSSWHFVLAWGDELGRPRFLSVRACSDFYRGARLWLHVDELLRSSAEIRFIHGLLDAIERTDFSASERLSELWHAEPRGAMEQIARFWRRPRDIRLLAHAAKRGDWTDARASAFFLRRALHHGTLPRPDAALRLLGVLAKRAAEPPSALIAFVGARSSGRSEVMQSVACDLAPAFPTGFTTIEHDFDEQHWRADVRVVFDAPHYARQFTDAIEVYSADPPSKSVTAVERAILRWLECRVESRHPAVMVGENPVAAQVFQYAARHNVPGLAPLMRMVLNSDVRCHIRSPILMPYPYGIVIERGTVIGSRVTVMQQVMIGRKNKDSGLPTIEDNVFIGPGAKVLGPVRIGRGATIGANAVVTRDVPSHCTVVGANRILGMEAPATVAPRRRSDQESVVNT